MTSAMAALRARTAHAHNRVDEAFASYDLGDRADYRAFLLAHARALPVAEAMVAGNDDLPATRARMPLLRRDLAELEEAMPLPLMLAASAEDAVAWGTLYVVEGSRLGGGILAGRVAAGLPVAYLSARHEPGEWRAFGKAIEAEADRHNETWLDLAVLAAEACFDLYLRAARS